MKIHFLKVAVGIAALGLLAGAGYFFLQPSAPEVAPAPLTSRQHAEPGVIQFAPDAPQLSSLKISTAHAVPLPVSDPVNGRVVVDENRTTRVTSPVPGRVLALHAEIGDAVARGALLAEIDSPELANAEADWRKAQADQQRKQLAFERAATLFNGEVLARKDYESAQTDLQQASAETRRALVKIRNLNATGSRDGRFSLRSPLAGVVADRQINPGLEVRPDLPNPLFVITDLNHLWVLLDVPETSIAGLHPGQPVSIETDAYPNQHFSARIDRIGLMLDPATRRIQVRCAVDNPQQKLKPEMFARVAFLAEDGARTAIALPNTSVFTEGVYNIVFVEKQPGKFEKRRVHLLLKGRDTSFADDGIATGERIVTEGGFLLNAEVASDAQ